MSRPPWESRELTPKEKHEQERYTDGVCPECGEKRRPPEMDVCPICHPEMDYDE